MSEKLTGIAAEETAMCQKKSVRASSLFPACFPVQERAPVLCYRSR